MFVLYIADSRNSGMKLTTCFKRGIDLIKEVSVTGHSLSSELQILLVGDQSNINTTERDLVTRAFPLIK